MRSFACARLCDLCVCFSFFSFAAFPIFFLLRNCTAERIVRMCRIRFQKYSLFSLFILAKNVVTKVFFFSFSRGLLYNKKNVQTYSLTNYIPSFYCGCSISRPATGKTKQTKKKTTTSNELFSFRIADNNILFATRMLT